ncbi:hypothetical protein C8Q69DRAFT_271487 [Paecilomyces variotii]|uniref:DUF7730 domain-containing protein n=1 Tax=Byssochlamys spectabilis TaxID=264951 RepID=A0A443HSQ8_BYSSP|nr:hypothetical protein C8Q69DRAFT_271487 [Paecilomyces variotii]KAJ9234107.1 hypothetical protein DTO166G5_5384 [Paecilomyces variotii]KAJ9364595.1 hypothetical protein DTO280E4_1375 [Paecilomyces variotii]RWQ94834.1 hypothetical protein C8Q69DRAFT_271487 [Paecilomyces variotii]
MARIKHGVFSWEDVLAQRYQSNKPSALPKPRRRTLAGQEHPEESPQSDTESGTPTQDASLLLTRLSPEVRLIIWEQVLGGRRLHIIQKCRRRLCHVSCPLRESCDICRGGLAQPAKDCEVPHDWDLLSLPMTCKQIYHESIHMVYSLNTFEFSNTWSLTYLRPTVPQERWDEIRAVELKWAFPGHWLPSKDPVKTIYVSAGRQQWLDTCKAITKMKNLQAFTLSLTGNWFSEPVEKIPVFLEPLRDLKLKQRWNVQLPEQPYYINEISELNDTMRKRGVDCSIQIA